MKRIVIKQVRIFHPVRELFAERQKQFAVPLLRNLPVFCGMRINISEYFLRYKYNIAITQIIIQKFFAGGTIIHEGKSCAFIPRIVAYARRACVILRGQKEPPVP